MKSRHRDTKKLTLCCVPPSKTDDQHCILQLLRFLSDRGRTNASSCLKRIKDIAPQRRKSYASDTL